MGPHNIRPREQTINFNDELVRGRTSDLNAKARQEFDHTFGPAAQPTVNPFASMGESPVGPHSHPPVTANGGFGALGTGMGAGVRPHDGIIAVGPLRTASFSPTSPRRDPALAGASLGHRDGFQAPRPSLGALARHGGAQRHPAVHPQQVAQHLPPRPHAQAAATRPQPNLGEVRVSARRTPSDPLAGTHAHVEVGPRHATHAGAAVAAHRPTTPLGRNAEFLTQVAAIRCDITRARIHLADASSPLLRHDQKTNELAQAHRNFASAQTALAALQADPNLSRNERLELARLSREPSFRTFAADSHEAEFNLRLDEATRDI